MTFEIRVQGHLFKTLSAFVRLQWSACRLSYYASWDSHGGTLCPDAVLYVGFQIWCPIKS